MQRIVSFLPKLRLSCCVSSDRQKNMHLIRRFFFYGFFVNSCIADIVINRSEPIESGLIKAVVQILHSCYGDRITAVGLSGSLIGTISERIWLTEDVPVTLIGAVTGSNDENVARQDAKHKLQVFVVSASSASSLSLELREIKASQWWNHMAIFIILNWRLSSCSTAFEMLSLAWEINILNAMLLCFDKVKRRMIYSFNPYTSFAPNIWNIDRIYSGKNNHPWTMFKRGYIETPEICDDLNFEKTHDLGGYEIRISVTNEMFGFDSGNNDRLCYGVLDDILCDIVLPPLNVTPKILVHGSVNTIGGVHADGMVDGILGEVASGFTDFSPFSRFQTSMPNLSFAYPHMPSELRCLTQYSGFKSQLSKIRSVIDNDSRTCLFIVIIVTILFFKFFVRQTITEAHMNTFRIVCNSSLPKIPSNLAPRIYLGSLFLFALTMQGIYQGQFASLLTKQEPLRNVNTMRDLAELGHIVYGSDTYWMHFIDSEFEGRFVGIKNISCTEYVLGNRKAACASDRSFIMNDAVKYNLHMSRDILVPIHEAMPIRPDWPLEQRVNTILLRSIEAYRIKYLYNNLTFGTYRLLHYQENKFKDRRPKVLTLRQLTFAFSILGIGLVFAVAILIVEIFII